MQKASDEQWLSFLLKSVSTQVIDGVEFPGFPPSDLQARFVGSSNEGALNEAFRFYQFVKRNAENAGAPLRPEQKLLDFGCGWGRYLRFFWKDIASENLHGCDVDPEALEVCRRTKVPGNLALITTDGRLPYPDAHFNVIMAYSVFTHLPEKSHLHWMEEIARVAAPGCIFCLTLEPRRFIDFVAGLSANAENRWYRALARYASEVQGYYRAFDAGEIAYLPTGGGPILNSSVYGDAVVPLSYIKKKWAPYFEVKQYIDDRTQFWQAALAVQRK